jgi:hypothetical protein
MSNNPLKQYFRQPALYMRLPTLGKWYNAADIELSEDNELPIYGLSALDDIMLNTPDALLNGQALENVIKNCVPNVKNVKALMVPDLEAIFLGMKIATNNGKYEIERKCPKCNIDVNFEVNCYSLMDRTTFIEETDTKIHFNEDLVVEVSPYTFEMRQMFMQRQFDEQQTLRLIDDQNKDLDNFEKARILGESVERLSIVTFNLVSMSIQSITLVKQNTVVTDKAQIAEWLVNIPKSQADIIIDTVNQLNVVGPQREVDAQCDKCNHSWTETLNFDPISFFGKR